MFNMDFTDVLDWLGEVEMSVERLDGDDSLTMARLRGLQREVKGRNSQFCSLTISGKDQMVVVAVESYIVLGSKVGELGRRWSMLQNMMIQDRLHRLGTSGNRW